MIQKFRMADNILKKMKHGKKDKSGENLKPESVSDSENGDMSEGRRPSTLFESKLGEMLKNNRLLVQALAHIDNEQEESSSDDDHEQQLDDFEQIEIDGSDGYSLDGLPRPSITGEEEFSYWDKFMDRLSAYGVEIMDAFAETNQDIPFTRPPPKHLNVNELRKNTKRCLQESRPYFEAFAGLKEIFIWQRPLSSLMLLIVYTYCVYNGWFVSFLLFLILLQLAINYLGYVRNVSLGLTFVPKSPLPPVNVDMAGAQLVVDISRKVQYLLEILADVMEKIKNLFLWKRPRVTAYFFFIISFWFLLSLFVSTSTYWTIIGLGIGGKLFITSYLFHRFPRLVHKWDVMVWFLDRLPNVKGLKNQAKHNTASTNNTSKMTTSFSFSTKPKERSGSSSAELKEKNAFSTQFGVEEREAPRLVKKCFLIDRELSFPYSTASGTVYFTDHYILFKYSLSSSRDKFKLHLSDIINIKKAHSIGHFMPGNGRAIEVHTINREKPYLFAGLGKRDECYEMLLFLGKKMDASFSQITCTEGED